MKVIIEIIINKILRFKRFTRAIDKKTFFFGGLFILLW